MKKISAHRLPGLFSPLDIVTILYVLVSGAYMCFGAGSFSFLLPHLTIRFMIIVLIIFLAVLGRRFSNPALCFVKNLYPLLFLSFFYGETSIMKNVIFDHNFDVYLYPLEQKLFGCQPSITFSKAMPQVWFSEMMSMFYFSYYIITGIICVVFYLIHPKHSQKHVFTIVLSFYLFYIIFDVVPAVGPQYYIQGAGLQIDPNHFFGKLMHSIINDFEQPTGAFPSSHVGLAVIVSLLTWRHYRALFFITLPFVLGICFATVYLREHYLVDALAGLLIAPLLFVFGGWVYSKLSFSSQNAIEPGGSS